MEEFNILEFIKYYFNKFVFVLVFILIGFVGSYFYTFYMQVPVYRSQTSLVLTNDNSSNTITQSDISLNKNLVSTYRQIIRSRRILDAVIENMALDIDYESLSSQIEVSSISDTELILISVYDEDKTQAKKIADEIAYVFKNEITDIYNIENVSIIDKALVSEKPYNVNVLRQFIIGGGLGFLISSIILTILFYMDDTVKTEEDIERKLGLTVLGVVPKYRGRNRG